MDPHLDNCTAKAKKIQNRPVAGESEAESESKEEQEAEEELVSYGSGEAGKPKGGEAEAEEVKKKQLVSGSRLYRARTADLQSQVTRTARGIDENQATKSTGWMPWHHTPKKDVASCEKQRGAASRHRSVDIRMGEPGR